MFFCYSTSNLFWTKQQRNKNTEKSNDVTFRFSKNFAKSCLSQTLIPWQKEFNPCVCTFKTCSQSYEKAKSYVCTFKQLCHKILHSNGKTTTSKLAHFVVTIISNFSKNGLGVLNAYVFKCTAKMHFKTPLDQNLQLGNTILLPC